MLLIECFYYPGCEALNVLPDRLASALAAEAIQAEVQHHIIAVQGGLKRGIKGSPTILINGVDIAEVQAEGLT
jgi:hypothetical protein